jgi:peptidoglycan hydrolase-like protein with peptidoglycan-binding domain
MYCTRLVCDVHALMNTMSGIAQNIDQARRMLSMEGNRMKKNMVKIIVSVLLSVMSVTSLAHGQALEFPAMGTTAKAGEYVLAANQDAANITSDQTVIFYTYTMVTPGEVESTIKDPFDERTVPNALIIPIPPGQTAEVGDVVLTWWQSGSGMKRAYVVDDKNPKEPIVKYIDIAYDNPAENKDGVPIGQMDEQLKPDSFFKLTGDFAPGTAIAIKDEEWNRYTHYQVINVVGDKVIVIGFAGKMAILDKAKCLPVLIMPKVKAGEKVYAKSMSSFSEVTVKKVDSKMGRVFTEKDDAIAFGDVINPVQMAQDFLIRLGYNPGPVDGAMGKKTEVAIRACQKDMNIPEDGQVSLELVEALYAQLNATEISGEPLQQKGKTDKAAPKEPEVQASKYAKTQKDVYASDEPIIVEFSGLPGNKQDWITVVTKETPDNSYAEYFYTQGKTQGNYTFKGLKPGEYEVRVYFDWPGGGYTVQDRFSFEVTE